MARLGQGVSVLISDLSDQEQIPKKFLEQILLGMKQKGLVSSRRGRTGGYFLAVDPHKVMVGDIIRMVDGPLAPLPCASETSFRKCDECPDIRFCGTSMIMRQVRDATAAILDKTSLASVCEKVDAARRSADGGEELMYYI
jgi:Rrf2 family protein